MKSVAQQIREMGDRLSALYNEGPADDMMNKAAGAHVAFGKDAAEFTEELMEPSELDRIKKLSGI